MLRALRAWWNCLRVQQKLWAILLVVFVPLVAALSVQVSLINNLLVAQQQHQELVLAREQIQVLRRLAVDIEDAFRGYLLTREDQFLKPLQEAEPKVRPTIDRLAGLVAKDPALAVELRAVSDRLHALLEFKRTLIARIRAGQPTEGVDTDYVQSSQGLTVSDALRDQLRAIEDGLDKRLQGFERTEAGLAERALWGWVLAVAGSVVLGGLGSRLLSRSITGPLAELQAAVARLGRCESDPVEPVLAVRTPDEIGQLAHSFEEMAQRIRSQLRELEAISAIGNEINTIGPDGLDGVLYRITNRAAELLQVDVCLVMLRNDQMGCWIVEAASGDWYQRLHKAVMLWEEFPISVQAFESRQPVIGEELRRDLRPQVVRRNLIGESMLSVPLLSRGEPFGVLVLLLDRKVPREAWNVRLAKGFADEAAMAISNARLFEAAHQKGKSLQLRLEQLEHLAEVLAHELKAPGERIAGLASGLLQSCDGNLDERTTRWVRLIEDNARDLNERVQNILEVARVVGRREALEAVDPALVLEDVLKARASELKQRHIRVSVQSDWPMIACHRAYLRQVFDNLISNAIKFAGNCPDPEIRISAERKAECIQFAVSDNGPGIPPQHRERVFEPFVRLNKVEKGSGIGLAIVRRIVELYGGRSWVESNEVGGCTVLFTLPVLGELTSKRAAIVEPVDPGRSESSIPGGLSEASGRLRSAMEQEV